MVFSGICLIAKDVKKLSDFYKRVLQTTSDCDSDIHQEIATQGTFLAILKGDNISESGNKNMSMAFTVDDVDKEYLRLIEMGIDIIDPSTVRPWGS